MPAVLAVAAIATTAYGAVEQNKAARNAASVDNATAAYNAKYDEAQAAQLDMNEQQNIKTARQDDAVYLSREAASYASAGVLATSGSALDAQVMNAGRMEQKIQQSWVDTQQREAGLYSKAKVGILEGAAAAQADKAQGTLALINGGARISGMAFSAYQDGVFS